MATKAAQSKKAVKEKKASGRRADVSILYHPRVTEKTAKANGQSVYVFDVAFGATKSEIAKAFEAVYKHAPLKVNVLTEKPKARTRRTARGVQVGSSNRTKKAYIYLAKGTSIEIM